MTLLQRFDEKFPNLLISGGTINGKEIGYIDKRAELKSLLQAELERCVPEEEDGAPDASNYAKGWNACRAEMLKRINT